MDVVPFTVIPEAVNSELERPTPPIVELPADRVLLLIKTPAIELLTVAGVEIEPLAVIVVIDEKKLLLFRVHAPILLVVFT
jgi:hypothetical protein